MLLSCDQLVSVERSISGPRPRAELLTVCIDIRSDKHKQGRSQGLVTSLLHIFVTVKADVYTYL